MTERYSPHGKLLGPYLLGELSAEEERELELHLERCPECRAELEELRQAHEFMRGVPGISPPPELKDRVLDRAKDRLSPRRRRTPVVLAAAALLVAAVLGVGLLRSITDDSSVPLSATALAPGASGVVRGEEAGENIRIELEVRDLPDLREDEYYEMWYANEEGGRISCGTFRVGPEGRTTVDFTTPVNARDYPEIEITREPDDGDPRASGEKVLSGDLRET